jgi:carboxylate-amine ligase
LHGWEQLADELRWGARAGAVPEPRLWWWEVRPHPTYGTLEVRVPDAQITVSDAAAVAAVVHALASWLADRHDAGDAFPTAPGWRIAENRWRACRHGLEAPLADLFSGEVKPARDRLGALLDELEPSAARIGCGEELDSARRLVKANGAQRQRAAAAENGLSGLAEWLGHQFLAGL